MNTKNATWRNRMINLNEMSESHILKQKDIRELARWSRSTFIRRMKIGMKTIFSKEEIFY